jgi:hypothetical protein
VQQQPLEEEMHKEQEHQGLLQEEQEQQRLQGLDLEQVVAAPHKRRQDVTRQGLV